MPTCLYIRGAPGTGKRTVADLLERDLRWPVVWVHHFDPVYAAIGEYKVPHLTGELVRCVASHLAGRGRDFVVVRPDRQATGMIELRRHVARFIPVLLTAQYETLVSRIVGRRKESPFRLTTKAALDEYLSDREFEPFYLEHVIATDDLTPEQVAGRIRELLPP